MGTDTKPNKISHYGYYLLVVFFNSFVDLGHKVLLQDTLYQTTYGSTYIMLSSLVNALILLPYIFLFMPAGWLADRFPKARVIKYTAACAIPIVILITWCYYEGWFWLAFICTLLLATQSVCNSPAKYGYIKELFGKEKIATANAWVQTIVIIAILAGTVLFTLFFQKLYDHHAVGELSKSQVIMIMAPLGWLLILCSLLETGATFFIPRFKAADANSRLQLKKTVNGEHIGDMWRLLREKPVIFTCCVGLGLFWAINQVLLASYGAFLQEHIPGTSVMFAQGSLALGGVGVLLGALYTGIVSRGHIETGIIPIATIGIAVCLCCLPLIHHHTSILILILIYGCFGGMFVVPLNALIQFNAKSSQLGKVIAGNNWIQYSLMLLFLLISVGLGLLKTDSIYLLYGLFVVAVFGAIYTMRRLPQAMIRYVMAITIRSFYSVRVNGIRNIPSHGGVLLLGNHVTFIDWAILQIASPRPIRFVMERGIFEKPFLKPLLKRAGVIPISAGASKAALESINSALNNGEVVAIFPEGRLSRNGQLGYFHTGYERAITDTTAIIVPFYLFGGWGSFSSYANPSQRHRPKQRRHMGVCFGKQLANTTSAAELKNHVTSLSIQAWDERKDIPRNIARAWLRAAKRKGEQLAVSDSLGTELSYHKLIAAVWSMAKRLRPLLKNENTVGVVLPASVGGALGNLLLWSLGKTVVNLNYTFGGDTLREVAKQSGIKTLLTSRRFCDQLGKKGFDVSGLLTDYKIIYLEDYKTRANKLRVAWRWLAVKCLPRFLLQAIFIKNTRPEQVAAILFSSGSEGKPKGVMLTHKNILSNNQQVIQVLNVCEDDVILGSLPLFHAFGLTVTMVLPVVEGIPFTCHPDPTDAAQIGKIVHKRKVSIICGTSTLFGIYTRSPKCLPLMFENVRLVIAGAEKLATSIREQFNNKFQVEILEGYGTTEVSPVASVNLPDVLDGRDWHVQTGKKIGTVGLPLPGCAFKVVDPESNKQLPIGEAGMVLIGGPQVMKGYLDNPEKTAAAIYVDSLGVRWYRTGDQGILDNDGFLSIVDRYARFIKIGGEMISLSAIEHKLTEALAEQHEALIAVACPDEKKGERLVVLIETKCDEQQLRALIQAAAIPNLMRPANWLIVEQIPKLASGKADIVGAKELAIAMLA